jgi:hypothetical protein
MTEQEDSEIPEDEDQGSFAYADYSGVVVMIQTYYYKTLELFRQYYLMMIKGKDHKPLKQQIQSYVLTLTQLLKRYESVQDNKEVNKIFIKLDKFVTTLETMNFNKLKECIDVISDAHHALGLSNIELKKRDPGKAMTSTKGY